MTLTTPAADAVSLPTLEVIGFRVSLPCEPELGTWLTEFNPNDADETEDSLHEPLVLKSTATARESALVAERDALRAVVDVAIAWAQASDLAATTAELMEESDFDPEMIEASTKADEACQAAEVELFEACRALSATAVEGV